MYEGHLLRPSGRSPQKGKSRWMMGQWTVSYQTANAEDGKNEKGGNVMTPERQAAIIAVLRQRGVIQPCQRCGHPTFEPCGERDITLKSLSKHLAMPTIMLACKQCGMLAEHAARPLGLAE